MITNVNAGIRYEQISAMTPEERAANGIEQKPNGSYRWTNKLGVNVSIWEGGVDRAGTITEPFADAVNRNFDGEPFAGQYGEKFKSTINAEGEGHISWAHPKNINKDKLWGYTSDDYHRHDIKDGSLGKLTRVH